MATDELDIGSVLRGELNEPSNAGKSYTYDPKKVGLVVVDLIQADASPDGIMVKHLADAGSDTSYIVNRLQEQVVPNTVRLMDCLRAHGGVVVFVRPLIGDEAMDWPRGYRAAIQAMGIAPTRHGLDSFEFLPELGVRESDLVVDKRTVSAFWGGNLAAILRHREVTHVLVTGLLTNYGVGVNAIDAANNGFEVTIVEDASAAISDQVHRDWLSMNDLFYRCDRTDVVIERLAT